MKVEKRSAEEITTIGIGGIHDIFYPENVKELKNLVEGGDFFVLGGGSNVVIPEVLEKRLISLKLFRNFAFSEETLTAGAGVTLKEILKEQIRGGFSLFEHLAGIRRATVGGLIAQNAGAYGFEVKERLIEVKFLSFESGEVEVLKDFDSFGYRKSPLPSLGIIVEATFKIKKDARVKEKIAHFVRKRLETQPPFYLKTAGSTFKNPPHPLPPAGKLLDQAGLKGFRVGRVGFSEKHANFAVNYGGATFEEFKELILTARKRVKEKFGVELELEVKVPCKI
ncbi:UDP-N-acetylmuramate dehydrogenase [Desulfurobacterium pacificum]|uniref:UDP-N-acetylenolpyruvoylglucosamine reductase n=1 Tax=Desulfurobacterium pacificum TaxID=240166 RepID=A0ABY1N810_9BACT|nr:UDP-N-acetylmuramate dehydrogenase [Desulfurobacterium pacificum]SMP02885.1 UDP-N-acetylmuramate dehydrogenase [Desulfurobacterium pacificum]